MKEPKTYNITFGYTGSKYYPQAVELAKLAHGYETMGSGENIWHIATFANNEDQIDLMAQLWRYAKHLPKYPELYGVEAWMLGLYLEKKNRFSYLWKEKMEEYQDSIH